MSDDGQRRGANQRRSVAVYVKQLDLFVKGMLLEETPAVLSLRDALWRSLVCAFHCVVRVKNRLCISVAQARWLQCMRTCVPLAGSWLISECVCTCTLACPCICIDTVWSRCVSAQKKRWWCANVAWCVAREEATCLSSRELDLFVNVMLLEIRAAVFSYRKNCERVNRTSCHTSVIFSCCGYTHNCFRTLHRSRWLNASVIHAYMCQCFRFDLLRLCNCNALFAGMVHLLIQHSSSQDSVICAENLRMQKEVASHTCDRRVAVKPVTTKPVVKNYISPKREQKNNCNDIALRTTRCPLYQRVLLRHLAPTYSTSSSQDSVIGAENQERSGSVSEEWRWNPLHKPARKRESKDRNEEREWQQRCARMKAWNLGKNEFKVKRRQGYILVSHGGMGAPGCVNEKTIGKKVCFWLVSELCIGSVKDVNSAELETMRTSRSPTTANGEVQTREEATVYVKQLDLFVKVMLLEETPAVLSLETLCEDHGYTHHWTNGQKPLLIQNGKRIDCSISNLCTMCGSWFVSEFFQLHLHISPSSSS